MRYAKLATIALLGVMLVAGVGCADKGKELYAQDRELIQAAVAEEITWTGEPYWGDPPWWWHFPIIDINVSVNVSGNEVVLGEDYYVIAACKLLISSFPKGILKEVPDSCEAGNGVYAGANAQPNITKCAVECAGHYLWLTTETGDIASICIGADCEAHGEDGFQCVYP
jgi:hypothetical protein